MLSGRLFTFDALTFQSRVFVVKSDSSNPLTGDNPSIQHLIDYNGFCNVPAEGTMVKEISIEEFTKIRNSEEIQLIDVREPDEHAIFNIGGQLISGGDILLYPDMISRNKRVIFYCKTGGRSKKAIRLLQDKFGMNNLYNLKGGLTAYI